jgi:hypothetical protein
LWGNKVYGEMKGIRSHKETKSLEVTREHNGGLDLRKLELGFICPQAFASVLR